MKLYTLEQAAEKLTLFHEGKPNVEHLKRIISKGEIEYINISPKYRAIEESTLIEYMESKRCREPIKDCKSGNEKTRANGVLVNTLKGKDVGSLAASEARKKLKMSLSKSSLNADKGNVMTLNTQ